MQIGTSGHKTVNCRRPEDKGQDQGQTRRRSRSRYLKNFNQTR